MESIRTKKVGSFYALTYHISEYGDAIVMYVRTCLSRDIAAALPYPFTIVNYMYLKLKCFVIMNSIFNI